ncbi:MAG: hypothetical protein C0603_00905 [Denitrovibrio sp.]|nr:MAG: hypothetical protein C0603_00905 [Denitrovibrio sp.]
MGSGDNIHHKRKAQRDFKRKSKALDTRPRILIVCEGEKTEPNYFREFPVKGNLVNVEIHGEGKNTRSLVEEAKRLARIANNNKEPYYQIWCVFDKDSFPQFNDAVKICESTKNFFAAYSNEAFEIWYLLHYNYHDAATSRTEYERMLSKNLKTKYEKNSKNMYAILLDKQPCAIRNAKKLRATYDSISPHSNNPCTTVYELVEELNKYIK